MSKELKPCQSCGGQCTIEKIDTDQIAATLWVCSNDALFGGDCADGRAYFSEAAWNTRTPIEGDTP